jgi:hypothetical protein
MARQILSLITAALTLWGMWLAGNKRSAGWIVGLVNQVFWLTTIIAFGVWGLLPLTGALTVVYSRNLLKWRREENVFDQSAEDRNLDRIGKQALQIKVLVEQRDEANKLLDQTIEVLRDVDTKWYAPADYAAWDWWEERAKPLLDNLEAREKNHGSA